MISLFESMDMEGFSVAMMSELLEGGIARERVAPLEFAAVDEPEGGGSQAPPVAEAEATFSVSERARQVIAMVNAARDETATAVREECTREFESAMAEAGERVAMLWAEYVRDRHAYFAEVERRVVELALAIARKVLAREAAVDAMHLTAVVRAALDRVQDESVSRLRVPVSAAADWRALFAHGDVRVEVVSDERLPAGTVRLETNVGQVELGVAAQLEEVELGFAKLTGGHHA